MNPATRLLLDIRMGFADLSHNVGQSRYWSAVHSIKRQRIGPWILCTLYWNTRIDIWLEAA